MRWRAACVPPVTARMETHSMPPICATSIGWWMRLPLATASSILVNCIGTQVEQPIGSVTEEAFDRVYAVNLKAAMFLAQAVARHQMAAGRGGKQIHLLSVRSQLGLRARGYSA
jgi:NAD(P)-dependent dehydrogenase (short-subunit alcohol dehydrogenase family)